MYGVPNGGPLSLRSSLSRVLCSLSVRMAEVIQKHDFSPVFAMRTRTGNLDGRAHRRGCSLPTNPLTDRHSMVSPESPESPPESPKILGFQNGECI